MNLVGLILKSGSLPGKTLCRADLPGEQRVAVGQQCFWQIFIVPRHGGEYRGRWANSYRIFDEFRRIQNHG